MNLKLNLELNFDDKDWTFFNLNTEIINIFLKKKQFCRDFLLSLIYQLSSGKILVFNGIVYLFKKNIFEIIKNKSFQVLKSTLNKMLLEIILAFFKGSNVICIKFNFRINENYKLVIKRLINDYIRLVAEEQLSQLHEQQKKQMQEENS